MPGSGPLIPSFEIYTVSKYGSLKNKISESQIFESQIFESQIS